MYNSKFAYETDKKLDKDSREIIYNRVIMQMKNGDVIKTIKDSKIINNAMLFFKIRFNTTDGTVLKYNYFITIDSLTKISEYLNKDDFNNNLHLADGI